MAALGFSLANFQDLRESILKEILKKDAILTEINEYGTLYVVDISVENPPKQAKVRTSWIIRTNEYFPRLTSSYIIT